jgi:hypothetical protein
MVRERTMEVDMNLSLKGLNSVLELSSGRPPAFRTLAA